MPVLDAPLADPRAVLAANRQQLGLNARNIYAVASPVRTSTPLLRGNAAALHDSTSNSLSKLLIS